MKKISVVINTKNAEKFLEIALKSIAWVDEIIVMDMASTDNTLKIARKYTDKIYKTKDTDYVEPARNKAVQKTSNNWILVVDADEEISPSLKKKLQEITNQTTQIWDIPRKNIVFNKWIKNTGWWPDYQRRFFIKGSVIWDDKIHSVPTFKGKIGKLPAKEEYAIIHHNYQSIAQFLNRLNRYTSIEAKTIKDSKKIDSSKIIKEAGDEFLRRFYQFAGHKDQLHGFSLSLLQSFYQVITTLKVWEKIGFPETEVKIEKSVKKLISDLKYWRAHSEYKKAKNPLSKLYWLLRRRLKL